MSELKAIRSGEIYNIIEYEDCYRTDDLYYPKSEADKVIADLKQIKKQQDVLLGKALNTISKSHKHIVSLARQCNHANYKRCLAMARCCESELYQYPQFGEQSSEERRLQKWLRLWLAIAEVFKEAK